MYPEHQDLLSFKIKTISRMMSRSIDCRITPLELTGSQTMLLGFLCSCDDRPVYSRDLERQFGLRHPTVSGLLQRLEAKGFIRCEPSREDRRCKRVLPTEKALRVHAQMHGHMLWIEHALSAGMSAAEIAQLHRLLNRMIQNIASTQEPVQQEGGSAL